MGARWTIISIRSRSFWCGEGFQTCCVADFQVGMPRGAFQHLRVWKTAIQQTWKSALQTRFEFRVEPE
jgi:hypothetical protein